MQHSWIELVDAVLRPSRAQLERCTRAREEHLVARRVVAEERARAIAACERHIESARASVFAADDGVVTLRMTELEREWRRLSRRDPDAGLMDLWAQIAPASWMDRKRWRDAAPATQLDVATLLAADVEGVEAAESAIGELRVALARWGTPIGSRIRWRLSERDSAVASELLAEPLRAARAVVTARDSASVVFACAERLERDVAAAARARFPERPQLAADLAHAAVVDCVWRAAAIADAPNPVTSLRELWKTGYGLVAFDASGVTLEIPPV